MDSENKKDLAKAAGGLAVGAGGLSILSATTATATAMASAGFLFPLAVTGVGLYGTYKGLCAVGRLWKRR